MQDKDGHSDYYVDDGTAPIWETAPNVYYADQVNHYYFDKVGVKIEHFEDVIKSRDETYAVLGRFYKEYKGAIPLL